MLQSLTFTNQFRALQFVSFIKCVSDFCRLNEGSKFGLEKKKENIVDVLSVIC